MAMRVGLLLFDGVDLLDVGGPYEVFLTTNRLAERRGDMVPFEVATVSRTDGPVAAYGGLGLVAGHTVADVGELDVLVVPGLIDLDRAAADGALHAAVRELAAGAQLTTSVCTGAFLLAHAGLVEGIPVTTHHEDLGGLAALVGEEHVVAARWVDAGTVVTAGGLSSGIAMALHLVDRLVGRDLAVASAEQIAYAWDPEDGIVVGN